MGYSATACTVPHKKKIVNRRRNFMPEPSCYPTVEPPIYHVAFSEEMPKKKHHRPRTIRAQITHTSCLTAIRDYVINMQRPKRRKHRKHKGSSDNAERLISSLKNDVQMISRYQQDSADNPKKIHSSDPFFVLSAMMCKINKLEDLIIRATDCEKQMARRRDMLITAGCIKKSLIEQMQCDEKLLKDKQRKICYLLKSLDMFEKQIRCMTKAIKYKCSTPKRPCTPVPSKSCICLCKDKNECSPVCPGRKPIPREPDTLPCPPKCPPSCSAPCSSPTPPCPAQTDKYLIRDPCEFADPCGTGKYDITGMNLTYTKSSVQSDPKGKESEEVQSKFCCTVDENEDCQVTVLRDGNKCPMDPCENMELKARLNTVSKIWLESARQLMDALNV